MGGMRIPQEKFIYTRFAENKGVPAGCDSEAKGGVTILPIRNRTLNCAISSTKIPNLANLAF